MEDKLKKLIRRFKVSRPGWYNASRTTANNTFVTPQSRKRIVIFSESESPDPQSGTSKLHGSGPHQYKDTRPPKTRRIPSWVPVRRPTGYPRSSTTSKPSNKEWWERGDLADEGDREDVETDNEEEESEEGDEALETPSMEDQSDHVHNTKGEAARGEKILRRSCIKNGAEKSISDTWDPDDQHTYSSSASRREEGASWAENASIEPIHTSTHTSPSLHNDDIGTEHFPNFAIVELPTPPQQQDMSLSSKNLADRDIGLSMNQEEGSTESRGPSFHKGEESTSFLGPLPLVLEQRQQPTFLPLLEDDAAELRALPR